MVASDKGFSIICISRRGSDRQRERGCGGGGENRERERDRLVLSGGIEWLE